LFDGVTDAQGPDRTKVIQAFGPQGSEVLGLYHFRYEGTPALAGQSDRHTIVLNRSTRWHDLSNELLDHLAESYGVGMGRGRRGFLASEQIRRINAYLAPRLEQTVAIDELAEVVAQSASHFPRLFRRTVGLSPHQYVVRLRLNRARELIGAGLPLAEAAIGSGFVDQSHLSYWVRRIYGTTPGRWGRSSDTQKSPI
jgi:AraC-like DNA-binding protein